MWICCVGEGRGEREFVCICTIDLKEKILNS